MKAQRFTKSDVETHREGYGYRHSPAVNVKAHRLGVYAADVAERFGCSEVTAEKALDYAFSMEQEIFWEDARELAQETFGNVKVYSEGRSGGWLIVQGLPDVETWDAIMVSKWGRFAKELERDVAWRCSADVLLGDIKANEWAMDADSLTAMLETV